MKFIQHAFMVGTVGLLAGCGTTGSDKQEPTALVTGSTEQSITVVDCQRQAGSCAKSAKSFLDLAACTAKFQSCTVQAATDLLGQGNLLKNCRTKADACLEGALTVTDISACRSVYEACASDVTETAGGVLTDAVGIAKDTIDKATDLALGVINAATGATGGALEALSSCEAKANTCLTGVVKVSDVSSCQDVFETCVGGAVSLVDKVAASLPIPSPSEVAADFAACQTQTQACLKGAITETDISACKGTLQTCVKGATTVADSAVDDLNKLLPPIIQVPTPSGTVDCAAAATKCLLTLGANPVTCATQATQCLTK